VAISMTVQPSDQMSACKKQFHSSQCRN